MKIKLSKAQWELIGKKTGWIKEAGKCNCGSGLESTWDYDARGIEIGKVCKKCKDKNRAKYRKDVLDNPNYETDEPVDPID